MNDCFICHKSSISVCQRCIAKNIDAFRNKNEAALRSATNYSNQVTSHLRHATTYQQELVSRIRNISAEIGYARALDTAARNRLAALNDLIAKRKATLSRWKATVQKKCEKQLNDLRSASKDQRKQRKEVKSQSIATRTILLSQLFSAYRIPIKYEQESTLLHIGPYHLTLRPHENNPSHYGSAFTILANCLRHLSQYLGIDLAYPVRFSTGRSSENGLIIEQSGVTASWATTSDLLTLGRLAAMLYVNLQLLHNAYSSVPRDEAMKDSFATLLTDLAQSPGTDLSTHRDHFGKSQNLAASKAIVSSMQSVQTWLTELMEADTFEIIER